MVFQRASGLQSIRASKGGSRTAATSKVEPAKLPAVNYYHKELHLGCCSSPRSASGIRTKFIP